MPAPTILLPHDPFSERRTDPHYSAEARLVRGLGGDTALVDHDALLAGRAVHAVRLVPAGLGPVWYRGWMLPVEAYAAFGRALADRGCQLLTTPAGYAAAHELPGWYRTFEGATPDSVWLPAGSGSVTLGALEQAAGQLGGSGPAIVKDFVKSRKHEWEEACFIPELADLPAVARVVRRFVELQGEFLAGGVVLRRFHAFAGATEPGGGARVAEARVWWMDGEPVLTGPHPDTPGVLPEPDLAAVRPLVRALGCRFVTTDLALRADGGGWMVVEVGDGQVSDLPRGTEVSALFASLIAA
ncbi:ATP-grasp domain-containing protein [Kitasatospora mediocidica]|uniref:ATP-grasp domain-containing protein n=1 Tax=Kitasatospora mediocidica TaxID=58352 RepID=UPI000562C858|nr:ATP-grasp domain-containing protein [Kitasatospora mediocidica]